ncbi:hypothetical protein BKN14_01425 [Candidatus Gracilibacteria bacterium HOT-871]|nr:hypothetical protein BKN14_01425 [Candidatus Gracilibacteria bacterium HOT-871]MBB1564529.1 hypothetical protein [Candidatus Gracilibacteria bacterium]MBF0914052.1 hypothetical protein [Candidatus Gracilibacteria bacterium]RKW23660.1 MAG: hypothetical protein D8B46_02995 [Candidatus Gracilibacteria bacterium]
MLDNLINIFYGILFITGGCLVLKYRRQIKNFAGDFVWAETYLGRGTTYLVLIIIGCGLIFIGALMPFGGPEILFRK